MDTAQHTTLYLATWDSRVRAQAVHLHHYS